MKSNAPCLFKYDNGSKCYSTVSEAGGYCKAHQPKPFSNRSVSTEPLPKNWGRLTQQVIARDKGICYRCGKLGADTADHFIARAHGGTDSLFNLRAIHHNVPPYCHEVKTREDILKGKFLNSNAPRKPVYMKDKDLDL